MELHLFMFQTFVYLPYVQIKKIRFGKSWLYRNSFWFIFVLEKKIEFIFIQSSLDYTLFLQREVHPHAVLPIANGRAYSRESSI